MGGAVAERSKALLLREKINEKTKDPGFTPWPGSISMMVIGSRVTSLLSLVQPLHKLHNVKILFCPTGPDHGECVCGKCSCNSEWDVPGKLARSEAENPVYEIVSTN